jgi:hypothetical protein
MRKMSRENPLWGAPEINRELLKLGIETGETSVGKYIAHHRKPPAQDSPLRCHRASYGGVDRAATP